MSELISFSQLYRRADVCAPTARKMLKNGAVKAHSQVGRVLLFEENAVAVLRDAVTHRRSKLKHPATV